MKIAHFGISGVLGSSLLKFDLAERTRIMEQSLSLRRWDNFYEMFMAKYDFTDLMEIYSYGCYCLSMGDRPLSGTNANRPPVDARDEQCKAWTTCYKCARIDVNKNCQPERVNYSWSMDENNNIVCAADNNPCKAAICECDKYFVENFKSIDHTFNTDFSEFHGFERQQNCYTSRDSSGSNGSGNSNTVTLECCGEAGKREFFNSETKMCCADGSIKPLGLC
ncbi:Oidioi.mRNA.OKI2018_I69.PAR.g10033.t1.cds [Oikopleura dioica]|uniref:Oidioi.mRNA.OKI2018_I69.PAR.g10033.t1.cds n=1 Tax=Oikopleura dioica TaxID=34765 RepID=A0ABN7RTX8_OIKDI|nr:Oidioi.mRNA.OKI2018_I69.PAR.g10033.t1.cds [Oikopleura dioica]